MVNCISDSKHTGGVSFYIKNSINYNVIANETFRRNWFLCIRISNREFDGLYTLVYHSPNDDRTIFIEHLEQNIVPNLVDLRCKNIFMGDFNINFNDVNARRKLENLMSSNGLFQRVEQNTRIVQHSATKIDLVFSNFIVPCITAPDFKISDHESIVLLSSGNTNSKAEYIEIKSWNRYTQTELLEILNDKLLLLNAIERVDINSEAEILCMALKDGVNSLIDVRSVFSKNNYCKWYNSSLMEKKRCKIEAHKAFLAGDINWNEYVLKRNDFFYEFRRTKFEYHQRKISNSGHDGSKMWKSLKEIYESKPRVRKEIEINGVLYQNVQDVAEKMNHYFIDSVLEINRSIQTTFWPHSFVQNELNSYLNEFAQINEEKFVATLLELKGGGTIDNIDKKVFIDAYPAIGKNFLEILNKSYRTGVVPKCFKKAEIVLIPKIAGSVKADEQRGINKLPVYEKVMELFVKKQLLDHFDNNNLLIKQQSGFRSNHSCETALNLLIEHFKRALDNKLVIVAVFLDFKKAFETISREKLINVLKTYGVRNLALKWFQSYLSDRTQSVKFFECRSTEKPNEHGVPQGSVLGPLLYIIYINDILTAINKCQVKLFADDAVVYCIDSSVENAVSRINQDLMSLNDWLQYKSIKLNASKSKYVIFSSYYVEDVLIEIDNNVIERVNEIKYLGVILDERLHFNAHLNYVVKKAGKKFGILCRIAPCLTLISKITIYKAIIAPHFEYCTTILFLLNHEQMYELQKIQNKCMRIILRCQRETPIQLMLDTLGWLSIKQRVYLKTMLFIRKISNGNVPGYLLDEVNRVGDTHNYNTRGRSDFRVPLYRRTSSTNSLFHKGFRIFNEMPREIKYCQIESQFKRKCILYIKENITL